MKGLRIIFMGTPEFAVATLGSLLMNGFNVVAVVTVPDKPAGRGRKMSKSAVKEFAEFSNLPILQPANLKDQEFINQLQSLKPDLLVVVAFRMLPEVIWKLPPYGTINLHASLLPDYRGAAPINHAIINGETVTGVTTFFINDKIDTGDIILQEEIQIYPFENAGDLHDKLMKMGARLVIRTLSELSENRHKRIAQSEVTMPGRSFKPAPKIHPHDCIIYWNNEAEKIHNLIRGLSPYPCARMSLRNESTVVSLKIFESRFETSEKASDPGTIESDGRNYIKISCKNGFINILSLQLEGKKRMSTVEFLRGFRISDYTVVVNRQA